MYFEDLSDELRMTRRHGQTGCLTVVVVLNVQGPGETERVEHCEEVSMDWTANTRHAESALLTCDGPQKP